MISMYVHISNLLQVYVVIVGQEREREQIFLAVFRNTIFAVERTPFDAQSIHCCARGQIDS